MSLRDELEGLFDNELTELPILLLLDAGEKS